MSKFIMFSTKFPKGHPRAGECTNFVPKIWKSLKDMGVPNIMDFINSSIDIGISESEAFGTVDDFNPKKHTIRAGHRWKAGDWFSPRIWSGKPYQSKQITIAPDIQIARTVDIEINSAGAVYNKQGTFIGHLGDWNNSVMREMAANDGLHSDDFFHWFKPSLKPYEILKFQIIIWDDSNLPY